MLPAQMCVRSSSEPSLQHFHLPTSSLPQAQRTKTPCSTFAPSFLSLPDQKFPRSLPHPLRIFYMFPTFFPQQSCDTLHYLDNAYQPNPRLPIPSSSPQSLSPLFQTSQ